MTQQLALAENVDFAERPKKLCIDLCAGLGGFSRAFKQQRWEVVTIDVERKHKPTILADVRYLPLREGLEPDALLMSPPCQRFSIACPEFPKKGIKLALEIVGACLEAVVSLKPKKWAMENPRGRLRWFIGKPKQTIRYSDYDKDFPTKKPTDVWGTIQLPMVKFQGIQKGRFNEIISRNPSKRAEIPQGVSLAVYEGAITA